MPYFFYNQIHLGPVVIYTWSLFLGLAFLVSYWFSVKQAKKQGIEEKKILWLFVFVFFAGIIGSRMIYVFQSFNYYLSHIPEIFQIWKGGLVFYGGFLGALIISWIYIRKNKLSFLQIADILSPAIALGIFIGRIGCSLINDHQGEITDLFWAIKWPDGTFRHPVAEYLVLNALIMFFVLLFLQKKVKKPGQLFIIFLFWYSVSRFFLDFTRATGTSLSDFYYYGLTISQWVSLFILLVLIVYQVCDFLRSKKVRS
ncbi:MAG: prolipoprotein diacylglyceryl transferase [bacterium]